MTEIFIDIFDYWCLYSSENVSICFIKMIKWLTSFPFKICFVISMFLLKSWGWKTFFRFLTVKNQFVNMFLYALTELWFYMNDRRSISLNSIWISFKQFSKFHTKKLINKKTFRLLRNNNGGKKWQILFLRKTKWQEKKNYVIQNNFLAQMRGSKFIN